jgi:phosphatidylethanolamine/phosphatidyl-N-methylethanolamine N-methyltransferase
MKLRFRNYLYITILFIFIFGIYQNRSYLYDSVQFLVSFAKSPTNVGAVAPSSPFLAEAIAKYVELKKDIRILEVGAGTGVFTKEIVERIGNKAIFDVVEIDKNFVEMLQEKFSDKSQVRIHHLSVLDWAPPYKYDVIISGVPLNAFDAELASKILEQYMKLIIPGGILSYFEYLGAAFAKKIVRNEKDKCILSQYDLTTPKKLIDRFQFDNEVVLANIPPARVHHLRIK